MATKQELFTKVTGLTFDVENVDPDKLAWLVPDGSMLSNKDGRKAKDTVAFLDAAGLDKNTKLSEVEISAYDDEDISDDDSSLDD